MRLKVLPIFLPILIISLVSMDIMAKTEYDSIKIRIKQKMYEITIPKGYHLNSYSSIEEQEYVFNLILFPSPFLKFKCEHRNFGNH